MYVPENSISSSVYTEIYLTLNGSKELSCFSKEYEDKVKQVKTEIETIEEERKQARYHEVIGEANEKVEEAQKQLAEEKEKADNQIKEAEKQLEEAKQKIEESEKELEEGKIRANKELKKAENQLISAEKEIKANQTKLEKGKADFESQKEDATTLKKTLKANQAEIEKGLKEAKQKQTQLAEAKQELEKQIVNLQELLKVETDPAKIEVLSKQLDAAQGQLAVIHNGISLVENTIKDLNENSQKVVSGIDSIDTQIAEGQKEINNNEKKLKTAQSELTTQKTKFQKTKQTTLNEFKNAEAKIIKGKEEITENEKKLEEEKQKAEEQIQEAQAKIDEAQDKIKEIKKPEWYVIDRQSNVGYAQYSQDTDRIANIGKVFPVVFFVVAALISLTSMTRMVEEQRSEIGTLKAIGYQKIQIARKYIIYAFFATMIGAFIGMTIGFRLLPDLIFRIYSMMYTLPPIQLEFNITYAITGLLLALACTCGATIIACIKELMETPASLMRPKAPKVGKRVLLEKIPFIWSHLKFTQKVTVRNIFRYKKRFLMTIIGIFGCTSLIVAGFGLRDSISHMIPAQYGEVFKYQLSTTFKDTASREEIENGVKAIQDFDEIDQCLNVNMQSVDILDKNNTQDIQLIVPEKPEEIQNFITLNDRKTKEVYCLENDTIIITEKLAKLLSIKVGDQLTLKNADDKQAKVTVGKITENYLLHYIYMTPELYQTLYGENLKYSVVLSKVKPLTEAQEKELGTELLTNHSISSITFTSATSKIFDEVMGNMNFVVWILIISAGLLAFVVLYNLSNVNISERIRELATIKVLGFYDKEVYKYVTRETIILTVIGIIIGLVGGYFLNMFIIQTCELDMFMFDKRVSNLSYLYSAVITALFAIIVNIATYFSLKKIDMIESLKSVE